MAAADQEARNVAILVASLHRRATAARRQVVRQPRPARGRRRTGVLTADGRDARRRRRAWPRTRTCAGARDGEALHASSTTRAAGCCIPVVEPSDGTAVVRTSVSDGGAAPRRGPGLGGHHRPGRRPADAAALLIALAAGPPDQRAAAATWPASRTGCARATSSARAEVAGTEETEELARALNGLAERTGELLAAERAAVGDLSHRLRTPVTALRLDAEAVDDPELAARLQEHIAVLQRTIDAIVARRAARCGPTSAPTCDAAATVAAAGRLLAGAGRGPGPPDARRRAARRRCGCRWPRTTSPTSSTCSSTTSSPTPPRARRSQVDPVGRRAAAQCWSSRTTDPELASRRPRDRPGSTGLGLDIARRTAAGCGGELTIVAGRGDRRQRQGPVSRSSPAAGRRLSPSHRGRRPRAHRGVSRRLVLRLVVVVRRRRRHRRSARRRSGSSDGSSASSPGSSAWSPPPRAAGCRSTWGRPRAVVAGQDDRVDDVR